MDPPSYEEVQRDDTNNFENFLASLGGIKGRQKDIEIIIMKNKMEQRTLGLKIIKEREKIKEAAKKLKTMELRKLHLQQEYNHLVKEHRTAEEF